MLPAAEAAAIPSFEEAARVAELQLERGDLGAGIALLSSVRGGPEATRWTNLSAAYLAAASTSQDSGRYLAWALNAAVQATEVAPTHPAAWFNLGLTLGQLGLRPQAQAAWERWGQLETDEGWRAEGLERRRQVAGPLPSSEWTKTRDRLLAPESPATEAFATDVSVQMPQASREVLEDDLLPRWGEASLAGNHAAARVYIERATWIAAALARRSGDALHLETVTQIAASTPDAVRSTLALGVVEYGEGRRLYEANSWEAAGHKFASARSRLVSVRSPMAGWAALQSALVVYQLRHAERLDRAGRLVARVLADMPRDRYPALSVRAHWLGGLVRMQKGDLEGAFEAFGRSMTLAEKIGEQENVAAIAGTAADTLRLVGDHETGWRYLRIALQNLRDIRAVRRRYTLLLNASLYASDEELPAAALFFQNASIEAARERGVPSTIVEGLVRRASLHSRRGDRNRALADLRVAGELLPRIVSTASREYQRGWWHSASAEADLLADPTLALERVRAGIRHFTAIEPAEVPRLHLLEGKALAVLGDAAAAESAFHAGVREFERRWTQLAVGQHQISYLDESWALFHELIDLYGRRGDFDLAFRHAESARARTLSSHQRTAGTVVQSPAAVRARLPEGTALVYYAMLERRLMIWCLTRDASDVHVADVSAAALAESISTYRRLLEIGAEPARLAGIARELYSRLIGPISPRLDDIETLVFVGDGPIHAVPFATLIEPRTGRFVVEDYAVAMAPSVTEFVRASSRLDRLRRAPVRRALVVGVSEAVRDLGLPKLPEAPREVKEVAAMYPVATTLVDADATPDRLTLLTASHDVFHFAGHARANLRFPALSALVLSPDQHHRTGTLTAAEIGAWHLSSARLVALSACRTAYGAVYRGEGVISLARPFLAAGVPSVVGALWDVSDTAARNLLTAFHRTYVASGDPVASLRAAQLQVLRDPSRRLRTATHWGAFTIISGVAGR